MSSYVCSLSSHCAVSAAVPLIPLRPSVCRPVCLSVSGVVSVDELERSLRSSSLDEEKRKEEYDTVRGRTRSLIHGLGQHETIGPPTHPPHCLTHPPTVPLLLCSPPLSQLSTPPGFAPSPAVASSVLPAASTATVSVPLPSDVYGSAPSLYIPLPARHFSSMSKSELALVIKLQLSQLQSQSSDSHHNDTFYSSVMEMRTKGRVSKSLQQLPPILHNRSHHPQTAATVSHHAAAGTIGGSNVGGAPVYFKPTDSTLGRLQTSSLKKPKKLMELASADQMPAEGGADDGRSARLRVRRARQTHSASASLYV